MSQVLLHRARRVRRLRIGVALVLAAVGLALALACGERRHSEGPMTPLSALFAPTHTVRLRSSTSASMGLQYVVQATPDELLAIESGTQDLWSLPLTDDRTARRLGTLRRRGRARVVGMAARVGRFGMLDLAGMLRLYHAGSVNASDRWSLTVPKGTRAVALLATADSSWLIVEQRSSGDPAARTMRDSVIVVSASPQGRMRTEWAFERAEPARSGSLMTDFVAATSFGDTVVLTAADPARITTWVRNTAGTLRQDILTGVRASPMSALDREALRVVAAPVYDPLTRAAQLPSHYPPIAGARPDGLGWFVVAGRGATSFALDYYCRNAFEQTLLDHPAVRTVTLLDSAVAVTREDLPGGGVAVEYYPYGVFARRCR